MAASKAEYLKKYLSTTENPEIKRKRRKKKPQSGNHHVGLKLVDEDIDISAVPTGAEIAAAEALAEEVPTIAEIIDERPEDVKHLEEFNNSKMWKKLQDEDQSPTRQEKSDFDESPLRRERHDSDISSSPPRRKRHDSDQSPHRRRHDSEESLPRRKRHDSDQSPPRKKRHDTDQSPPRRKRHDSDQSPPRRKRHDTDQSPARRKRHDSDQSPPRRKRHDIDQSPPRRKRHDSDQSPPRRKRHDSDQSPPRRKRHGSDHSPPRRKRHDSDQSPPRRRRRNSDQSPPRRIRNNSDQSPPRRKQKTAESKELSPSGKKTLSGKTAGLSSAAEMRKEAEKLKRKEAAMFEKLGGDLLGKDSATVFRDKKTGKRRDVAAEKQEDGEKKAAWKSKYDEWNKGLKQGASEQERVEDLVHEMQKPMARFKDDSDLDSMLKQQDRDGDPMLAMMKKKQAKKKGPIYPKYKGPAPPPNRYNIAPGYRWDGVDRSLGFEKKYFLSLSNKKAVDNEAYKWSIEDM